MTTWIVAGVVVLFLSFAWRSAEQPVARATIRATRGDNGRGI